MTEKNWEEPSRQKKTMDKKTTNEKNTKNNGPIYVETMQI